MLRIEILGDGPPQPELDVHERIRQKIYTWYKRIAALGGRGTGHFAIQDEELNSPVHTWVVDIRIPMTMALGTPDGSSTSAALRYTVRFVKDFDSAHLVNLELPVVFTISLVVKESMQRSKQYPGQGLRFSFALFRLASFHFLRLKSL